MPVLVVADDLIWSTRLVELVRGAGGMPIPVRDAAGLRRARTAAPVLGPAIVDLTARGYDPLGVVGELAGLGLRVVCVGQHEDHDGRKAALAAGAAQVLAYRKLSEDGAAVMRRWLAGGGAEGADPATASEEDDGWA